MADFFDSRVCASSSSLVRGRCFGAIKEGMRQRRGGLPAEDNRSVICWRVIGVEVWNHSGPISSSEVEDN
jgi:hypothetical protein